MNNEIKVGNIVILISDYYGSSPHNPVYSKYKIKGKVVSVGAHITVAWDNGRTNVYRSEHLAKKIKSHPLTKIFK